MCARAFRFESRGFGCFGNDRFDCLWNSRMWRDDTDTRLQSNRISVRSVSIAIAVKNDHCAVAREITTPGGSWGSFCEIP